MKNKKHILPASLLLSVLALAPNVQARDLTISGGITTGYEWYERNYDKDGTLTSNSYKDDKYSRFRIGPLIEIESLSARDEMRFSYSPSFYYDIDSYDHDVDHDLSAEYNRFITQKWRMLLAEQYLRTDTTGDNAYIDPSNSTQILDTNGRRQYWINDLSLTSEYTYWEGSLFSLGYTYSIYEDVDSTVLTGNNNYDRHAFSAGIDHRFDPFWKLSVSGDYVRGLYDETPLPGGTGATIDRDVTEYHGSTTLESRLIEHHPLSLGYSFSINEYDNSDTPSSTIQNTTFGWQWLVSKDLTFNLGGGPSYAKTEGQDGTWGYNANLSLQQAIERGSFGFAANHGFDQQNFNGTDQNGLQKYTQARVNFDYQLLENVSFGLFSSYRNEDLDTISQISSVGGAQIETVNKKIFSAGTNLSYLFMHYYTVALSYTYAKQDSEQIGDSYDEHRVALTLSYNKDWFHW